MRKVTLLSLVLMVVLTSCGPVTAVPSVTETPFQSPTPAFTSTPEPRADVSNYQLRTWDEASFQGLMNESSAWVDTNKVPYDLEPTYTIPLDREFLFRFPESKLRYEIISNALQTEPKTIIPSLPIDDPTGGMIAQILNDGTQIQDLQGKLEDLGWYVDKTISINNLIGNGQDALVLIIKTKWGVKMGVFAVVSDKGRYRVEKVRDWDWAAGPGLGINFEIFDVGDINENSLPEFVLVRSELSGGSMAKIGVEILDHFEWSQKTSAFQLTRFPLTSQLCIWYDNETDKKPKSGVGPCTSDWKFSHEGSSRRLITQNYWDTQVGCPTLIVQRVSTWDGRHYVLGKPEVLRPDDKLSPECRLAWADTAVSMSIPGWQHEDLTEPGWDNELAISIIEQSLKNWPTKADEWWGTASRDYFRLKLGLWRELRGEKDQAISLLMQVATNPYDARFDFASHLSMQYLQERKTEGNLIACDNLYDAFFDEFFKVVPDPLTLNFSSSAQFSLLEMKKTWGFVPMEIRLCNSIFILSAEVKNRRLTSTEMLDDWLGTLPYPVYQNTPIDLNRDGLDDRLVFLKTRDGDALDVWAFFMTADGYIAKYFDYSDAKDDHSEITIIPLDISSELKAFILPYENSISIDVLKPDFQIDTDAYYFQPFVQSYKVISRTQPVQVMVDVMVQNEKSTSMLSWDDLSQNFVEQNAIDLELSQIEKVLYVDQDYSSVIDRVDTLLANSNFESNVATLCGISVADDFCVDFPKEYIAYFLYMRALSFEQMGLVNDARDAYYQLWQKYPQNLFGIIASKKLEPVQP